MTFKSIMVHIDDGQVCERRIEVAVRMARRFGSRLVGIYLVPPPDWVWADAELLPPLDVAKRISAEEAQHRAKTLFKRGAESLTAAKVEFRAPVGDPIDAAIAHMRCGDLAIIGQADIKNDKLGLARRLAEHVVLGSGGPIVLLPYAGAPVELGTNVAIAWDAGREAARAVRDALPILAAATRVTVLSTAHEHDALVEMTRSHARLAAYLAAHAIEAQFKCLEGTSHEAGERLLSQVADAGADLVVMGGYGHARVRELVLGGATRTMLEAMTVPC